MIDFGLEQSHLMLLGAACLAAMLALPLLAAVRRELAKFRGRCSAFTAALLVMCLLGAFVVGGTKTNGVNNLPPHPLLMLPAPGSSLQTVDEADVLRGFRLDAVTTNEGFSYAMPIDGVRDDEWHLAGGHSAYRRYELAWPFPIGTGGVSSVVALQSGGLCRTPRDEPFAGGFEGMLSFRPGVSDFWTRFGEDRQVFTWVDTMPYDDTNDITSVQVALVPDGGFAVRSNAVESVYRRVNPDDWDGDGLANGLDANPTAYDGDFFGVANALPSNANPDAYYWLDLSVTGRLGVATIRVTCDGPSDLGDHVVIVRTNEVCHVPLLAGATYAVESDLPFGHSSVSSEYAEICTNGESRLSVSLPLEISFERVAMRGGTDSYVAHTSPVDVGPRILNVSGCCCSCVTNETGFTWNCGTECRCVGGDHTLFTSASWEGYSRVLQLEMQCPCASEHDDENGACVNIAFTNAVVIFENQYTNAPGVVVPRRSTETALMCRVVGGRFGGSVAVTLTNGDKILRTGGAVFPGSASTAAGEEVLLSATFEGLAESGAVGDIVATAVFSENMTGRQLERATSLTSARVKVEADATFPSNKLRHVFGPQETATFQSIPALGGSRWHVGGTNAVGSSYSYLAPDEPTNVVSSFSVASVNFPFDLSVIAPVELDATAWRAASTNEWLAKTGNCPVAGDVAVGMIVELRLLPDYVSFGQLFLQEGACPATNISGFFEPYASGILPHEANEGAWNEIKVSIVDNSAGIDSALVDFGVISVPMSDGAFEYCITNYWYVKEGGGVYGQMHPFYTSPMAVTLSANGTLSVEKFGCVATRGTNDITTITRRP